MLRIHSEGGVNERYCVLCNEEGKPNETAREMVTIRPRSGGEPGRVAVCPAHLEPSASLRRHMWSLNLPKVSPLDGLLDRAKSTNE